MGVFSHSWRHCARDHDVMCFMAHYVINFAPRWLALGLCWLDVFALANAAVCPIQMSPVSMWHLSTKFSLRAYMSSC